MRFHFTDPRRHRRVTKALARRLPALGLDIGHTGAADIAARLFGYADRRELDACLGKGTPSEWDEDVPGSVAASRLDRQSRVLADLSLDADAVARLLGDLRPTARDMPSARTAKVTAQPVRPTVSQVPSTGIAALLASWEDTHPKESALVQRGETLFRAMAIQTYTEGFEKFSVGIVPSNLSLRVTASHDTAHRLIHVGTEDNGIALDEYLSTVEGIMVPVTHEGVTIRSISFGRLHGYEIRDIWLLDSLRPSPPPLKYYGISPSADAWIEALASRIGLHVVCSDDGMERLPSSLQSNLIPMGMNLNSLRPIRAAASRYGQRPSTNLRDNAYDDIPHGKPETFELFSHAHNSPREIFSALKAGRSVIVFVSSLDKKPSTPEGFIRDLLAAGMPVDFLRRHLVSTLTRIDKPLIGFIPPDHASGNGMHRMRWQLELIGATEAQAA